MHVRTPLVQDSAGRIAAFASLDLPPLTSPLLPQASWCRILSPTESLQATYMLKGCQNLGRLEGCAHLLTCSPVYS